MLCVLNIKAADDVECGDKKTNEEEDDKERKNALINGMQLSLTRASREEVKATMLQGEKRMKEQMTRDVMRRRKKR